MKMNYLPKNGYVIAIQKLDEAKTASGIYLAQSSRKQQRTAEVLATDTDIVKVGDTIIADLSSGSYLEDDDNGSIIAIPSDEIIAVVKR